MKIKFAFGCSEFMSVNGWVYTYYYTYIDYLCTKQNRYYGARLLWAAWNAVEAKLIT